jgi:hypothetical protein
VIFANPVIKEIAEKYFVPAAFNTWDRSNSNYNKVYTIATGVTSGLFLPRARKFNLARDRSPEGMEWQTLSAVYEKRWKDG